MRTALIVTLAGSVLSLVPVAAAQDAPPAQDQRSPGSQPAPITEEEKVGIGREYQTAWIGDWRLTLGGGAQHAFTADLDDAGDVSVTRAGGDLTLAFSPAEKLRATVGVEGEVSIYDFDDASGIVPGTDDPWDELYVFGINSTLAYTIDDTWSVIGGGFINAGFESGADFADSLYGGGFVGAGYQVSPSLALRFGVGVRTQIEDNIDVVPIIGLDWRINDTLALRSQGLGLRLSADLNDEVTLYLGGEYQYRQYRLDEDRDQLPNGVARDRSVPIGVGVVWTPIKGLSLALEGGAIVWQEYEVLSENGVKRSDEETDPTPYIGVRLEYRF